MIKAAAKQGAKSVFPPLRPAVPVRIAKTLCELQKPCEGKFPFPAAAACFPHCRRWENRLYLRGQCCAVRFCTDNFARVRFAPDTFVSGILVPGTLVPGTLVAGTLVPGGFIPIAFLRHSFMPSDFMPSGFTSHNFVWHSFVRRAAPPHIGKGNVGEPLLPRRRACLPLPRMRPPV